MKKIKIILAGLMIGFLCVTPVHAEENKDSDKYFASSTQKPDEVEQIPFDESNRISDNSNRTDGVWKNNSTGWWYEYKDGSYPKKKWVMIDTKWYYFNENGYMETDCYRDGYWLKTDGTYDANYSNGMWKSNSTGKWFEDNNWNPVDKWVKIDGCWYYFNMDGYVETNIYVNGYYVDENGIYIEGVRK
jgi:glucan-binding YG repeat protein